MEDLVMETSGGFWHGKRVLITGHTGFKGSWLTLCLQRLLADITGIALTPHTAPSLFELAHIADGITNQYCDIRDASALTKAIRNARPEIAFHLAAQSLVRASYRDPAGTYDTNVMGTAHLLESLRGLDSIRVVVIVTTDKVYRNNEWHYPYREIDTLGGYDPYSASKAASEIIVASYRDSYMTAQGVAVATARAGNVIGGGDWSEDRLIPDAVRAWHLGKPLEIRRPQAIRPWQHVLEPLTGYLTLAEKLWNRPELVGAFNFGPPADDAVTVREVVDQARASFGNGEVNYGREDTGPHEAECLKLDTSKVRTILGITPQWTVANAVERTIAWYRGHYNGIDALQLCEADFREYGLIAKMTNGGRQ